MDVRAQQMHVTGDTQHSVSTRWNLFPCNGPLARNSPLTSPLPLTINSDFQKPLLTRSVPLWWGCRRKILWSRSAFRSRFTGGNTYSTTDYVVCIRVIVCSDYVENTTAYSSMYFYLHLCHGQRLQTRTAVIAHRTAALRHLQGPSAL